MGEAVLGFVDRREDGGFPVFGADGSPLARITVPWGARRFAVTAADGTPLCTGAPGPPFSRSWVVRDPAGATLLTVRSGFWTGARRTVTLPGGRTLLLRHDAWPGRDWAVTDADGRTALGIASAAGRWSLHPDAYTVEVADPALSTAQVIGLVQVNRLLVKRARSAAAAAG